MRLLDRRTRRAALAAIGTGALVAIGAPLAAPAHAATTVPGAVPFAQADFSGYSAGNEAHIAALPLATAGQAAQVIQGFSGASSDGPSQHLTAPITGDDAGTAGGGLLVQPAQAATVNAFGTGTGLSAGVGSAPDGSTNQIDQAGTATQVAAPYCPPVTKSLPSGSGIDVPMGTLTAGALSGTGAAFYDPTSCPLGQPLSYGTGDAANVDALDFAGASSTTSGSTTTTAAATGSTTTTPLSTVTGPASSVAGAVGGAAGAGSTTTTPGATPSLPALGLPTTGSLVDSSGVSETDSETFLSANGDGTFGYTTQAREIIAPLTVDLFGAATLSITVSGSATAGTAPGPVTLTARTTGESSGAAVTLASNDFIGVDLTPAGSTQSTQIVPPTSLQQLVGQGGVTIPLDLQMLAVKFPALLANLPVPSAADPVTSAIGALFGQVSSATGAATTALPDVSFGSISIGTPVRAINTPDAMVPTPPTMVGGTQAAGAVDVADVQLGISGSAAAIAALPFTIPGASTTGATNVADVTVGHLEASATDAAPITCTLPVIKSASTQSVTAGGTYTYTITIPDPAKLADLSCDLSNVSAVDTITDFQGQPLFQVTAASDGGTFTNQPSLMSSTITWQGLSYTLGDPPITLTVTVAVPPGSPAGTIQDLVAATGTLSGCTGGASGIANLGGADGTTLNGAYTLQAPAVVAAAAQTAAASGAPAATLPFTGGPSGLWEPAGGLAALVAGGGVLLVLRRSRRGR